MADWQTVASGPQVKDDDDDVPEDWENEPEEKPKKPVSPEPSSIPKPVPSTKKKSLLKKKPAGDEKTSDDEFLESLKEPNREYTADELADLHKRAELHRAEGNLNMVSELVNASGERQSLDNLNLLTKEEFTDYSFRLYNRLELLSKSEHYPEFLDNLLTGLTKSLSIDQVRRMGLTLQVVLNRKSTEEKDKKTKAKVKKPVKPQLKAERRADYDSFGGTGTNAVEEEGDFDQENDFM